MKTTVVLVSLFAAVGAIAHPGGLDTNGGHIDRKTGVYHYHRGTNAPSSNAPGATLSPQLAPVPPVAAPQSQATTPVASNSHGATKRIGVETKVTETGKKEAEESSASVLKNLPWWVYLVGLGCGYVIWELASYYQQNKRKR